MDPYHKKISKVLFKLAAKIKSTVPECICNNKIEVCSCECSDPDVSKLLRLRKLLEGMRNLLNDHKDRLTKRELLLKDYVDGAKKLENVLSDFRKSNVKKVEECSNCKVCDDCQNFREKENFLLNLITKCKDCYGKAGEKIMQESKAIKYILTEMADIEEEEKRLTLCLHM